MADVDCLAVTFCLEQVCACVDYGTMELYVPYEEARDVLPPRNHFYNTIWFRGGSGTLPLPKITCLSRLAETTGGSFGYPCNRDWVHVSG